MLVSTNRYQSTIQVFSELQTSFGINNVAISRGRPKIFNIRDLISEFVDFRMEVVIRRAKFELKKAEDRAHLLEGFLKVIADKDHLDAAISIIRGSATPDEAKQGLIAKSVLPTNGIYQLPYLTIEATKQLLRSRHWA
jgi:DNA gyrase/topoisomerase IV subunit A